MSSFQEIFKKVPPNDAHIARETQRGLAIDPSCTISILLCSDLKLALFASPLEGTAPKCDRT